MAAFLSDELSLFLDTLSPFEWGVSDCCQMVTAWAAELAGQHPSPEYICAYCDEAGAHAILEQGGGIISLLGSVLRRAGFCETEYAQRGDIGVVLTRTVNGEEPAAAICAGRRWVLTSATRLHFVRAEPLKVWTWPKR